MLASLGDYVDGVLGEQLCAEIERHLQGCNRCTIVVNTLKKTVELYHETVPQEEMPEDVRKRLYLRLNMEDYIK